MHTRLIDYNGDGKWTHDAILKRYLAVCAELGTTPQVFGAHEYARRETHWVFPVMDHIIAAIANSDRASIVIGIEFIEEDRHISFGRILKSNAARALRRAELSESQRARIRHRVFAMLRAGLVGHEFREYAKLVRTIGFHRSDIGDVPGTSARVKRFLRYFEMKAIDRVC